MKTNVLQVKQELKLNINKSSDSLNCLVTGFDPFEEHKFNPSQELVNRSPDSIMLSGRKERVNLHRLVMEVCGEKAWPELKLVLDKMTENKKPCVIVMFGLAASRKNVSLERFALNIKDGNRKDNYGHIYNGEAIEVGGPEAIRSRAPIEEALAHLKKKGLPAEISNFCSTYVCNEIYYKVLRYFEKRKINNIISFVHIPQTKSYGKTLAEKGTKATKALATSEKKQLEAMQLVLTNLVQFYAQNILDD